MPAAVDSVFELAFWYSDRALDDNEYLQPIKLQYILFLSQAYFAVAYNGKKLVPAIFVADDVGPIEPSVHRAWIRGRPIFEGDVKLSNDVRIFADSIWRRFGHHSAEYLAKMCQRSPCYRTAYQRGMRGEIYLEEMRDDFTRAHDTPAVEKVVKPKIMRSHKGKAVAVKAWMLRKVVVKK